MNTVSKKQILSAFENLCRAYGVVSAGFKPEDITAPIDGDKYDGKDRWAISYKPKLGYMIVCGWRGCGALFVRWNGYIRYRWEFLMLLEALTDVRISNNLEQSRDAQRNNQNSSLLTQKG
jgi:hypothetical protein